MGIYNKRRFFFSSKWKTCRFICWLCSCNRIWYQCKKVNFYSCEYHTTNNTREALFWCSWPIDLSDVIVAKNIRSENELLRLANDQKQEGKRDLSLYVLNNVEKCVKLIHTTWEMENVRREMERESKTRIQLLRKFCDVDCVVGCSGQWLECAKQTLKRNSYGTAVFTEVVRLILQMGRVKYRNILITDPANCGKSFILNPLTIIYRNLLIQHKTHLHGLEQKRQKSFT